VKTVTLTEFNIQHLKLTDQFEPTLAHDEVLVRLEAASLNYVDLLIVKGLLNPNISLPYTPVCDGAGVVEQVGEGVETFKPGDKVVSLFIPQWRSGQPTPEAVDASTRPGLGGVAGHLSEYKVFKSYELLKAPKNLSSLESSTLPIAALTAWNALRYGNIKSGNTVLLHGTGGVSMFALQFAKAAGASVVMTSSSDSKLERVKQMGANLTINYKTTPEWGKTVLEFTEGRGVDSVVEVVGGDNLQKSLDVLKLGGHISMMGLLTGFETKLNAGALLTKQAGIQGMEVGNAADQVAMHRAIEQLDLRPVVDKVFTLQETQEGFKTLEAGAFFGKIVIKLN
jgi:NADPH:quinone reductase-like Zn-dependent oxidoreductase